MKSAIGVINFKALSEYDTDDEEIYLADRLLSFDGIWGPHSKQRKIESFKEITRSTKF